MLPPGKYTYYYSVDGVAEIDNLCPKINSDESSKLSEINIQQTNYI